MAGTELLQAVVADLDHQNAQLRSTLATMREVRGRRPLEWWGVLGSGSAWMTVNDQK